MRFATLCGALAAALFVVLPVFARAGQLDAGTEALKQLSFEELMDVEVTSVSKRPERLFETAAAIQVISGQEIQASGAQSIPEALRLADNLQVAQKNSHDWAISSRGFNTELGNKLLVMMDGRSVYTPLFSGVFWNVQDYPLDDLDRIEVISGPGGTLWGANAVNGVINVISRSAKDTQGLSAQAGGGSHWQDFATVRYGGELAPDTYFRVYGKYFEGDAEARADGSRSGDAWRQGRAGFRIDRQQSTQDSLTFQGDIYRGSADHTTTTDTRVSGNNLLGRWTHNGAENSGLSLQWYYDRTHISLPVPALAFAPAGVLADDLKTYDLDFQHHFLVGSRQDFVWGLGYRHTHDQVMNALSVSFFPATLHQDLFSTFLQDRITLRPDLFFTAGTKVEHNDYTGVEVEPSIRLQWNAGAGQMLWTAVSRAVRTPSRIDHDLQEPVASTGLVVLQGGADFQSETLLAYELGFRSQLSARLATSIATFYNQYDDVRSATPSAHPTLPGSPFPLVFQNDLEGRTYGAELSADFQALEAWRLHAGYNFLQENLRVKPGHVDINNAHNETADPQQQFSIRSDLALGPRLDLNLNLRWVDTLYSNNGGTVGRVPGYSELNARVAWRLAPGLEISLIGQNLLHAQHPEYGFPGPARTEIQRSIFGRIQWRH